MIYMCTDILRSFHELLGIKRARTKDEAHEVPVPDEPLAVDDMETGEEPVGVPRRATDEQQAGDAPAPAQGDHHEVGEAQHVGAVEADHQQQPHLLP